MSSTKVIVTFYWVIAIFLGHWKLQYMIHFNPQSIFTRQVFIFSVGDSWRSERLGICTQWGGRYQLLSSRGWRHVQVLLTLTELLLIMGIRWLLGLTWKSRKNTTYSGEISYNEAWGTDVFIEEEALFFRPFALYGV